NLDLNKLIRVHILVLAVLAELHRRIAGSTGFLPAVQIAHPLFLGNVVLVFVVDYRLQADRPLLAGNDTTIRPFAQLDGLFEIVVNRRIQPLNQFVVGHCPPPENGSLKNRQIRLTDANDNAYHLFTKCNGRFIWSLSSGAKRSFQPHLWVGLFLLRGITSAIANPSTNPPGCASFAMLPNPNHSGRGVNPMTIHANAKVTRAGGNWNLGRRR